MSALMRRLRFARAWVPLHKMYCGQLVTTLSIPNTRCLPGGMSCLYTVLVLVMVFPNVYPLKATYSAGVMTERNLLKLFN